MIITFFATQNEFRKWLIKYHTNETQLIVGFYKVGSNKLSMTWSESVDQALCFGWIDGIRRKLSETQTMQLISPRQVQHWTKTYKDRFAKLEKEGRMMDAGRAVVLLSKKQGLWDFMDDVDNLIKPADFLLALEQSPPALQCFDAFGAASKRFMLRYIKIAKTPATREKRIQQIALLAKDNKKLPGS